MKYLQIVDHLEMYCLHDPLSGQHGVLMPPVNAHVHDTGHDTIKFCPS